MHFAKFYVNCGQLVVYVCVMCWCAYLSAVVEYLCILSW